MKTYLVLADASLLPLAVHAGEFKNFIGTTFTDVPAGEFMMGSCKQSKEEEFLGTSKCKHPEVKASPREQPRRAVSVQRFQLGKYEVTLGEFKKYIVANPGFFADSNLKFSFMNSNRHGDSVPVVFVSWRDAQNFIDWLNRNKPASDKGRYRLPSEAEWEYAARAGAETAYAFGDRITPAMANFDRPWANGEMNPVPVGSYKPNRFGIHDMHGGAWEWVQDCWHPSYAGAPSDGSAWEDGSCDERVLRGGAWSSSTERIAELRSATRTPDNEHSLDKTTGFRLVRELP